MFIRTKIVCTMGPAVNTKEKILALIDAGMNCARINFSHGTLEEHGKVIAQLKEAREEKGVPLAIMLDTKGPEIRVGSLPKGELIIEPGQEIFLSSIPIIPSSVVEVLEPKMTILFDDGSISCEVVRKKGSEIVIYCRGGGILKSNKKVNIPGANIDLPAMTKQDIEDITFGCKQEVDVIAASFIRSAEHVLEIKKLLIDLGKPHTMVLAKIESRQGVENFENIVEVADGIMVARGDLGVELPLEQVPVLQKMMIRVCNEACKPVITATQMLESMTKNPRPTRAEVSDVANAIYDSTSAVMLSAETAVGLYPIETVSMMRKIIEETEEDCDYHSFFEQETRGENHGVSLSVALSSVQTAYNAEAKAIFVSSSSGFTVNLISRFRPQMPIFAQTPNPAVYHRLALSWGVHPIPCVSAPHAKEAILACSAFAMKQGILKWGDLIVMTAGYLFGVTGTTNMMMLETVGDVLVRGQSGVGKRTSGKVCLVPHSAEKKFAIPKGSIVVLTRCELTMEPRLRGAAGIILQNHPQDPHSEKCALELAEKIGLAVVVQAAGAFNTLQEGMHVTLDPERGLVFKG